MREWLVGGALIEGDDGVLLVCNRRRDDSYDWSPPGGVIDEGETMLAGLTREVHEETGLVVHEWEGPLYEVEIIAGDMGWHLRVEAYRAVHYTGELALTDPDGIVVDARFVPDVEASVTLAGSARWVHEPVGEWLQGRWADRRAFRYQVFGTDRASMVVHRL